MRVQGKLLAAVGVAIALVAASVASPAVASSSIVTTVNSVTRVGGELVYDVTVDATSTAAQCLQGNCVVALEMTQLAGNNVVGLTTAAMDSSGHLVYEFTGAVRTTQISTFTGYVWNPVDGTTDETSTSSTDPGDPNDVQISLTVNSIGRTVSENYLTYDVTVTANDYGLPGEVCASSYGCNVYLEARHADGSLEGLGNVVVASGSDSVYPLVQEFTTTGLNRSPVVAFRAGMVPSYGNVSPLETDDVAVTDPYRTAAIYLAVNSIGRSSQGGLTYDLTVTAANYGSAGAVCANVGYLECDELIEATRPDGSTFLLTYRAIDQSGYPNVQQFTSTGTTTAQITALRAYIQVGTGSSPDPVSTAVIPVTDNYPKQKVSLKVLSVGRNSSGDLTYDVKAKVSMVTIPGTVCEAVGYYYCQLVIEGTHADGTTTVLDTRDIWTGVPYPVPTYPDTEEFISSGVSTSTIVGLRAYVHVASNWTIFVSSPVVQTSENVVNGQDVDAAISLIASSASLGGEPCLVLFQRGTHLNESTVSDQELACEAAIQNGQSISTILRTIAAGSALAGMTYSLQHLEDLAGVSANQATTAATGATVADGQVSLPSNCAYFSTWSINCTTGGVTTPYRSPVAPILGDPVQESNDLQEFDQNIPAGQEPQAPASGNLAGATTSELESAYVDSCENQIASETTLSNGTVTTMGDEAGITAGDCTSMPIFFSGSDLGKATEHAVTAIASNPSWMKLTFKSNAEKEAAGEYRKSSWSNTIECANQPDENQCDEYPYYASEEGYPAQQDPSLLSIPRADNSAQSVALRAFFNTKCPNIKAAPISSSGRKFLVVPVQQMPTYWYCGVNQ